MQCTISILLAAVLVSNAFAADEHKERAKLPPEMEQVSGIAMAAPPEFAASALLRLGSRVTDKDLRRDLIEMAFRFAAQARNPVRLLAYPGSDEDTRTGNLASALRLKMDALSLQSRAVLDLIPINPARARELFGEIKKPTINRATCQDSLLPDMEPYYDVLAAVAQSTFTEKERAKAEHLAFLRTALTSMSSIAEIGPAAQALARLDWPREQFEIALGVFTSGLDRMPQDSRSFLYFSKSIESSVGLLVARSRQAGSAPDPLIAKYRAFVVAQLRGPHCADGGKVAAQVVQMGQAAELFGVAIRGDRPPLKPEEMVPSSVEGEMKLDRYWQTSEASRIYLACMKLRQGPGGTVSDEVRRSPEWTAQVTEFLSSLANWRSGGEDSEADFYHEKATVYEALLELVPPGEISDRVLTDYVSFLKGSNLQQENTVEWFWHARSTVNRVKSNHPDQAAKILAAYKASGNVVLVLEAMLEQVAPEASNFQPGNAAR